MSSMKEMAQEYRIAAAKLAMSIAQHRAAGDLSPMAMQSLRQALQDTRAVARLLSGYYDFPRAEDGLTLQGLKARRIRDDK